MNPAVIVAGNPIVGSNKQIKTPGLVYERVIADMWPSCKYAELIWSASASDFGELYLHAPYNTDLAKWNRAFLITVKNYNEYVRMVWACIHPIYIKKTIDLHTVGLASAIYSSAWR